MTTDTYQLEIYNGSTYTPKATGFLDDLRVDVASISKPWRIVLPEKSRPAKPRYFTPRRSRSHAMSKDETVRNYLDWALESGLETVTLYEHQSTGWPRKVRRVSVSDILGNPPPPEELN